MGDRYLRSVRLHDRPAYRRDPLYDSAPAILPPAPDRSPEQRLERQALEALYDATDGPNWAQDDNWNTDADLRQWYGVDTSSSDPCGWVIALGLTGHYLRGTLPAELGNLTHLEVLHLDFNELSGPIPAELGTLTQLRELFLNSNELSGTVPAGLGRLTRLQNLHLYRNELSSPIPAELGNMTRLRVLEIWDNQLSGPVPAELGNLSNLRKLSLNRNQLSGPLPSSLTNLLRLEELLFNENAGLCAPSDAEFLNWLNGIPHVAGPMCGAP